MWLSVLVFSPDFSSGVVKFIIWEFHSSLILGFGGGGGQFKLIIVLLEQRVLYLVVFGQQISSKNGMVEVIVTGIGALKSKL